jgi:hypothetical protein
MSMLRIRYANQTNALLIKSWVLMASAQIVQSTLIQTLKVNNALLTHVEKMRSLRPTESVSTAHNTTRSMNLARSVSSQAVIL